MKQIFQIEKTKRRRKSSWSAEEDSLLITLAETQKNKSWKRLSQTFRNKTAYQCYLRYRSINPTLRKGTWDSTEDEQILKAIEVYGKKWNLIRRC
jgi:myb proto-oncogene protein